MRLRSLLFVPADRPERFEKAAAAGADALIIDLEDSVAITQKDIGRAVVVQVLRQPPAGPKIFIRINSLGSPHLRADLEALSGLKADGIVLPKAEGADSVIVLQGQLAAAGVPNIAILPIATETPFAIFQLGTYVKVAPALAGLTWGAEDLPAAIGAITSREEDGRYTPPYELARSLTLFAAHAAGVPAIETVFPDFRNLDGLTAYVTRAVRDGFAGMMAIHPSQVAIINAAFMPSKTDINHAQTVIAAFAANPGVGALQLDGVMIDTPHLKQAKEILKRAGVSI